MAEPFSNNGGSPEFQNIERGNKEMADNTVIGKVTQIVGAVLDVKFRDGKLPEINEAIRITRSDGSKLVVEVAQH
jgi:hypothetical protein